MRKESGTRRKMRRWLNERLGAFDSGVGGLGRT